MILKYGARNEHVGRVHQALIEQGYEIGLLELGDSFYGYSTVDAVTDFQSHHVDFGGHALLRDGITGPRTWWSLTHPNGPKWSFIAPDWRCEPSQIREPVRQVVQAAVGDIGRHELPPGSNEGPDLEKYKNDGQRWCAYAVSAWFGSAVSGSPFTHPIASAYKFKLWGKEHGCLLGMDAIPQAGDVCGVIRKTGFGHVELHVGTLPDGRYCCVGGNVGDAVRGTVHRPGAFSFYVRPIPLI